MEEAERTIVEQLIKGVGISRPELTIPAVPPSTNVAMGKGQRGQRRYHEDKAIFAEDVFGAMGEQKFTPPRPPCVMFYRIWYPTARRYDLHNYEKAITDAVFGRKDDRDVLPWRLWPGIDQDHPRTELWFVPLKEKPVLRVKRKRGLPPRLRRRRNPKRKRRLP